jgi:hypothetical protein
MRSDAKRNRLATRRNTHRRLGVEVLESRSLLAVTLSPIVEASFRDTSGDGAADSINSSFPGLVRQIPSAEDRAIVEFPLAGIPQSVDLAVLDFQIFGNIFGDPVRSFDIVAYPGDGVANLADYAASGNLLRNVSYWAAQAGGSFRLDVTSEVRGALTAGMTHLGILVDATAAVGPQTFADAVITINGAPAPTWQRGWETVPNAIRTDGVESFHVEVNTHGDVASVTLAPWDTRLIPPSAGVVPLRDDGQNGDRVAGDFIYTSGAFRYDSSKPFPTPFYQNDADSPPGLSMLNVGSISITELDGAVNTFLTSVDVGLVRHDIPNVQVNSLNSNVAVSNHLINVNGTAAAAQRTLRGPKVVIDQATQILYQALPGDDFDFLNFFSTYKVEESPRLSSANFHAGIHITAQRNYSGVGQPAFDNSDYYGSDGRLLGINLLDTLGRGLAGSNATHELVHQWAAYFHPSLGISDGTHFNFNTNIGSLVGGQQWIDNGDGSFTINYDEGRSGATHASPLDLYLMGLIDAAEVPPIQRFNPAVSPPKGPHNPVILPEEIITPVTIDQIVAQNGVRSPGPDAAQRDFKIGFVAESLGRFLNPTEMTYYEILAAHYARQLPADEPDPWVGFGWSSITRFFGHDTTWSTLLPGRTEAPNQAPVVQGAEFSIPEDLPWGSVVGRVAGSDPDNDTIVFTIKNNRTNLFAIDPDTGDIRLNRPLDYEAASEYELTVVVGDLALPSLPDSATVTIRVTDVNEYAPVIAPGQTFDIAEGSAAGAAVGQVAATDGDGSAVLQEFRIIAGNDDGAFAIDSSSGAITVADASRLDHEAAPLRELAVTVSDGMFTAASQIVTINIADVNEPPVIPPRDAFSVAENSPPGTFIDQFFAMDPEGATLRDFAIVAGNDDGAFAVETDSGEIRVADSANLDFESVTSRLIQVTVSDGVHTSAPQSITINITNMNEPPVIEPGQSFDVAENSAQGTLVGQVIATDVDAGTVLQNFTIVSGNEDGAFAINSSSGAITVANPSKLDFESATLRTLNVTVSDGSLSAIIQSVTVNITNVNEAPAITTGQTFSIAENSGSGTLIGQVEASDVDAGTTLQNFTIVSGNEDGAFVIGASSGRITVAESSRLDFESANSHILQITVSDGALTSAAQSVTIEITDLNEAPLIGAQTFSIAENSAGGTVVGQVVAADADAGQTLSFAIVAGNVDNAFALNAGSGVLTVNNAAALDYEQRVSIALTVQVSDNGAPALSSSAIVTVNLTDVVEAPRIDVKPGDATNTINLKTESEVAVAILSSAGFDATTQVDLASLRFGRTGAEDSLVRHRKTGKPETELRDVDGDGRLDLVAYFTTSKTGLQVGDTSATLSGAMTGGAHFNVTQSVTVIAPKGKGGRERGFRNAE